MILSVAKTIQRQWQMNEIQHRWNVRLAWARTGTSADGGHRLILSVTQLLLVISDEEEHSETTARISFVAFYSVLLITSRPHQLFL